MKKEEIIEKLKKSELTGRGGAAFPTCLKWQLVKNAKADKKYIICNGSEGEPGVFKDRFILKHFSEEVINGIRVALGTIDKSEAIIYLRHDYYKKFGKKLKKLIGVSPITLFKKTGGYLAGEESVVCQSIEGGTLEPRIKPPFTSEVGLHGKPTLVNNVETFYYVSKIQKGEYEKTRFYSISGDVKNKGVYEYPVDWTILRILMESKNLPDFDPTADEIDFFVQIGGGSCGNILLPNELDTPATGQAAIIIYNTKKTDLWKLMQSWVDFFYKENCDKCVPCREGIYRIKEMVDKKSIDKEKLANIHMSMQKSSFCGLGKMATCPFKDVSDKLL